MISKKSLVAVLDKSIILTITAPNDNAKSISVQCALWKKVRLHGKKLQNATNGLY